MTVFDAKFLSKIYSEQVRCIDDIISVNYRVFDTYVDFIDGWMRNSNVLLSSEVPEGTMRSPAEPPDVDKEWMDNVSYLKAATEGI